MLETYTHPSWLSVITGVATRLIRQPIATMRELQLEHAAFTGDASAVDGLYHRLKIPTIIELRKAATYVGVTEKNNTLPYDFERTRQWFVMLERVGLKTGKGLSETAINETQRLIGAMANHSASRPRFSSLPQADLYATFLQSTSPDIRHTANTEFARLRFIQAVTVFGSLTESQHRFLTTNHLASEQKRVITAAGQFDTDEFAQRICALEQTFQRGLRMQYLKDIQTITGSLPDGYETMDMMRISDLDLEAMQSLDRYDSRRLQLETELNQTLLEPRGYLRQATAMALELYDSFNSGMSGDGIAVLGTAMQSGMFASLWDEYQGRTQTTATV